MAHSRERTRMHRGKHFGKMSLGFLPPFLGAHSELFPPRSLREGEKRKKRVALKLRLLSQALFMPITEKITGQKFLSPLSRCRNSQESP